MSPLTEQRLRMSADRSRRRSRTTEHHGENSENKWRGGRGGRGPGLAVRRVDLEAGRENLTRGIACSQHAPPGGGGSGEQIFGIEQCFGREETTAFTGVLRLTRSSDQIV